MCSEETISCIWSRVGRLTVDMVPPETAAACGTACGTGFLDGEETVSGGRAGCRGTVGATAAGRTGWRGTLRSALRAAPSPTRSAIAPPRTAPVSSSRVMRPRSTSTMRLATSSTSSRFCSTISIESRCLSRSACRMAAISWTIDGWMPSDGSSSTRSQGEATSARASARICCSPPDSVPPRRSSSRASLRKNADHAVDRVLLGLPRIRGPGQPEVFLRAQAGQDAAALRHVADAEAAALVRRPLRDIDAVDDDLAPGRRHQAHDGLQQGGLAHAVVADDADRLAFAQRQRDAAQHRHLAIAGTQVGNVEHDVAADPAFLAALVADIRLEAHRARLPR